MVVVDTHVVIWWTVAPELLSSTARDAIESADRIGVASISFWETALLIRKGRLELDMSVTSWAHRALSIPRVVELRMDSMTAIHADSLEMHPDPADRFIVAEALKQRCPLVTKDTLIRELSFVETIW
jgi:PIN domain nuclease of toxin-antitoxin system